MNALTTVRNRLLIHSAIVVASTVVLPIAAQPAFAQTETTAGSVNNLPGPPPQAPVVTDVASGVDVKLKVQQSVINWTNFNVVDSTRTINFTDTTGLGAGTVVSVLNRVVGNGVDPIEMSVINGKVTSDANVVVWISNPNGITFGAGGKFSGGSLVLTTAALDDSDFNGANTVYKLSGSSGAALTLNATSLVTAAGDVVLAGQNISASGTINATSGKVALIAAQDIDLTISPGSPLTYTIKAGTTVGTATLRADGSINADSIVLTGAGRRTSGSESDLLLEIGGTLTATAVSGKIFIGTETGTTKVGGNNDAMKLVGNTTLTGGTVEIASNLDSDGTARTLAITGDAKLSGRLGSAAALASLSVSGSTDFLAAGTTALPSVTTITTQDYAGPVTLSADTVLTGTAVTFGGTVNGAKALEINGDAVLKNALGNATALTSVLVTGKTDFQYAGTTANPSVTTTGTQEYQGDATLTGNTVLKGTTVTMGGTVNGAKAYEVQGDAVFKNALGNATALTSVLVTGKTDFQYAGTTATPSVTTTGTQEYQGDATLTGNTVLKGTTVTMGGTVNGAKAYEVQGDAVFTKALGNDTALTSVLVTGKTDFQYAGSTANPSVTTTGTQEYQGAATLTGNTVLKGSTVIMGGNVNGAKAYEVQGDAVFTKALGNDTALTSVLVTGKTDFQYAGATGSPSVTTTGTQTYKGAATLTGNTVLKGTTVTMGGIVDGGKLLEVQGNAVFQNVIGSNTALISVNVTGTTDFQAAGTTATPSVTTTGTQDYQGAATLTGNTVLKGSAVTFGNTVNGGKALEIQGDAVFKNALGNATALTSVLVTGKTDFQYAGTTANPSVTTTGTQEYQGAATLTGNTVLKGTTVTMGGTVNGAKLLEVQGDAVLKGIVGGTTALTSVKVTGKTDFQAAGTTATPSVTTTGTQEYQGAATLTGNTVLKGTTVTMGGTVNGAKLLEVQGDAVLKGVIGGTTALASIKVTGKTDFQTAGTTATPSVTTTGAQDYQGAATLTGNTVLKGSTVTFGGTVDGAKLLEVQGDAVLKGIVGGTTALTSVKVTGKTDFQAAGTLATPSVTTAGTQTYTGAATLTADTVLKGTSVDFGSTIDAAVAGDQLLQIVGSASFAGKVGATKQLESIEVSGGTAITAAANADLNALKFIKLDATGPITTAGLTTTDTITGSGDILVNQNGGVGVVTIGGDVSAMGKYYVTGTSVTLGDSAARTQSAAGSVSITATTGSITQGAGALTLQSDRFGNGSRPLNVTATAGSVMLADSVLVGGTITGPFTFGHQSDVSVDAFNGAVLKDLHGYDVSVFSKTGIASAAWASAANNITVNGGQAYLGLGDGPTGPDGRSAGGYIHVLSGTGASSSTLVTGRAVGDIWVYSIAGSASMLSSATSHGSSVTIDGGTTATAGGDVWAKTTYTVTGGTGVVLGDSSSRTQTAGGKVTIKATTGNVTQGSGVLTLVSDHDGSGGDPLTVTAVTGAVSLAPSLLSGGSITFTKTGAVYGNTSDVLVDAKTNATVTEAHGLNVTVNAAGGDAIVTTAGAANAIAVTGSNNASLGTGTAGGTILVKGTAGNATLGDGASTGASITVNAGKLATVSGNISAKTTYDVLGGTGVVLGDSLARTQTAGGAVTIKATTGDVTQIVLTPGLLTLQSNNDGLGTEALGVTATTGNVTLANSKLVGGTITGPAYGLQSDVTVTADKNATLAELAGLNVKVTATTGLATVLRNVAAKADYTVTGGTGVVLGDATARTQTAGGKVTITATKGDVTQGSALLTLQSDNDGTGTRAASDSLTIKAADAAGSVLLGNTVALGGTPAGKQSDVFLDAGKDVVIKEASGRTIALRGAAGSVTADKLDALEDIYGKAGTTLSVTTSAIAGDDLALTSAGNMTVVYGEANGTGVDGNRVDLAAPTLAVIPGDSADGAGSKIVLLSSAGDLTATSLKTTGTGGNITATATTGNFTLTGSASPVLPAATSAGSSAGTIKVTAGKLVTISNDIAAKADYTVTGGTGVVLGDTSARTHTAGGAVAITAQTGDVTQGTGRLTLQSNNDGVGSEALGVTATTGNVTLANSRLVGGTISGLTYGLQSDVTVTAAKDATLAELAGLNVKATAGSIATVLENVAAKADYTVTGGTGVVLGDATARTQTAGGKVTITATKGDVTQGSALLTLQSDNDGTGTRGASDSLTVKAADAAGSVLLGNTVALGGTPAGKQSDVFLDAGKDVVIKEASGRTIALRGAAGSVTADKLDALEDIYGKSGTTLSVTTSALAGDDLNLTSGSGMTVILGEAKGTGVDGNKVDLAAATLAVSAGGDPAGSNVDLVASTGNLVATTLKASGTNGNINATATKGDASVTTATANGAIAVTATNGAALLSGGTAGKSITVSGGSATLTSGNVGVTIPGTGSTISVLSGTGNALMTTGTASGAVLVKSTGANATVVDAASTGSSITVDANKLATVSGTVSAKTTYGVTGGTGVVLGDSSARTQAAGGAVTITATTGNVSQGSGLLTVQSDNDGTAGDPLAIKALTGSVTLANSVLKAGTNRQSDVSIDAADNASLALVDGRDIAIKSNRIALGGAVTGGTSVTLTNRAVRADGTTAAVNNTEIGTTGDESSLFVLTAAEIANFTAPTVRVVTEQRSGGVQNVTLGSFVVKATTTNFGVHTLPIDTTADAAKITITGAITGPGFTGTLQIGGNTSALARTDNIEGQVATGTIDIPTGNLDLRANRIVFGLNNLLTDPIVVARNTTNIANQIVANAGSSLYLLGNSAASVTSAGAAPNTYLRANTMKVSYSNFALFQNSGTPGLQAGVHLGADNFSVSQTTPTLLLDSSTPAGTEDAFGMFGKINGYIGRTAGLLPETVILYSTGTGTSRTVLITQSNSRINGCVIGSPDKGCLITDVQPPALKLFDERQAQIFSTGDEDLRIILDPLVGTNNEALLGDLAVPTLNYEAPTCELKADKTCKETK
ncbi:MAG: filamentous hemagglutinin N-terminal domain-containing protein [Novosphingobium sp.]